MKSSCFGICFAGLYVPEFRFHRKLNEKKLKLCTKLYHSNFITFLRSFHICYFAYLFVVSAKTREQSAIDKSTRTFCCVFHVKSVDVTIYHVLGGKQHCEKIKDNVGFCVWNDALMPKLVLDLGTLKIAFCCFVSAAIRR